MTLTELLPNIQTGDAILVDGTGIVSDLIELDTQGRFSHAGIFFHLTEGLIVLLTEMEHPDIAGAEEGDLWVGEMWLGKSFDTHPAAKFLSISEGTYYLGVAPECVRSQPDKVLAKIENLIRTQPEYGLKEFPEILAAHIFYLQINPTTILPVCSIALELCWIVCGVVFKFSLAVPADFDNIVAGTVEIEVPK